jgi:hypothetical protein
MTTPEPEADADPRPWEEPGAVRRDYEPHRATWLLGLGLAAFFLGWLSFVAVAIPLLFGKSPAVFLASLPCAALGGSLGGAGLRVAGRDLAAIRTGQMDPEGRQTTAAGRLFAAAGLGLAVLGAALTVLGLALVL